MKEIQSLSSVVEHVKGDVLVLFDIDFTLTHPKEHAFRHKYFFGKRSLWLPHFGELDDKRWEVLLMLLSQNYGSELIEESAPKVINQLRSYGAWTIAFTAAYPKALHREGDWRHSDLYTLGIDFSLQGSEVAGEMENYRGGILYSKGQPKIATFQGFYDSLLIKPDQIIMVDDRKKDLESIDAFAKGHNIPFKPLLFTGARDMAHCDELDDATLLNRYLALLENARPYFDRAFS